jgi:hypothetical protein
MDFLKAEEKKFKEPRYDDVYFEGVAALDADAGEPINVQSLIVRDPFDPARIDDLLKNFHAEVDKMAQKVQSMVVVDDASCHLATLMEGQAGQLYNALDKTRIAEKSPYKKMTDYIDDNIGGLAKRVQQIRNLIKQPITQYLAKKKAEQAEAERKAKAEAARIQKELDDKAEADRKAAADEARLKALEEGKTKKQAEADAQHAAALVEDAPIVVAETVAGVKVQTSAGTADLKEEDCWTVTNFKELPDAAFEAFKKDGPVEGKSEWPHTFIRKQIAAGVRNIPGVKISKRAKLRTSTSRVSGRNAYSDGKF